MKIAMLFGAKQALRWRWLQEKIVFEAPTPVFTWFECLDDRMARAAKMLRGVLVGGVIAAAHVAAAQAQPQVNPPVTRLQTLLTAVRCERLHVSHLIQVRACTVLHSFLHWPSLPFRVAKLSRNFRSEAHT
jgi:hypothetical protein